MAILLRWQHAVATVLTVYGLCWEDASYVSKINQFIMWPFKHVGYVRSIRYHRKPSSSYMRRSLHHPKIAVTGNAGTRKPVRDMRMAKAGPDSGVTGWSLPLLPQLRRKLDGVRVVVALKHLQALVSGNRREFNKVRELFSHGRDGAVPKIMEPEIQDPAANYRSIEGGGKSEAG